MVENLWCKGSPLPALYVLLQNLGTLAAIDLIRETPGDPLPWRAWALPTTQITGAWEGFSFDPAWSNQDLPRSAFLSSDLEGKVWRFSFHPAKGFLCNTES